MIANYSYAKSWWGANKTVVDPLTEKQAKKRHDKGEEYAVLVGGLERPNIYLNVILKRTFILLSYFDHLLRVYLNYHFEVVEKGIFLGQRSRRHFWQDADKVERAALHLFNEDGSGFLQASIYNPQEAIQREPEAAESITFTKDMSQNYTKVPDFGNYDYLVNTDWSEVLDIYPTYR